MAQELRAGYRPLSSWSGRLAAAGLAVFLGVCPLAAQPAGPGDAERAKAAIEKSIQKDPSNSVLWSHLGFAWRHLENMEEAQRAFERAAALNPRNLPAQFMLGLIYEKKKLKDQAITAWTACLASPEPRVRDIAKSHIHQLGGK